MSIRGFGKVCCISVAVMTAAGILFGAKRDSLLEEKIGEAKAQLERYGVSLDVGGCEWNGLTNVEMRNVRLKKEKGVDFVADKMVVEISVLSWLKNENPVEQVTFGGMDIDLSYGSMTCEIKGSGKLNLYDHSSFFHFSCASENSKGIEFGKLIIGSKPVNDSTFQLGYLIDRPQIDHRSISDCKIGYRAIYGSMKAEINKDRVKLKGDEGIIANGQKISTNVELIKKDDRLSGSLNFPYQNAEVFSRSVPHDFLPHFDRIHAGGKISAGFTVENDSSGTHFDFDFRGNPGFRFSDFPFLDELPAVHDDRVTVHLQEMNPLLVSCVLIAEDAGFYQHRGINKNILRLALNDNIREGKMLRGGGTISMQLVRNLFLSKTKSMDRKIEEMLLAFGMEESGMLSKDQILELYLNIIEWGPGVYGISEASEFYFQKEPAGLNINECIFLSMIIPNPKMYFTLLENDGSLTPFAMDFYDSMRFFLYGEDLISDEEMDAEYPLFPMLLNKKRQISA